MMYSIQLAAPKAPRLRVTVKRRAQAFAILLGEYSAAHPGANMDAVTVLEVALWKASRR